MPPNYDLGMNRQRFLSVAGILTFTALAVRADVNSGSNGSDGAFHPTVNTVIDMSSRPDGIYQYSSVTIPTGVEVSFIPNAANTPVVWLVQADCIVAGQINISGKRATSVSGGAAGLGGFAGGRGSLGAGSSGLDGLGPGGGRGGGSSTYFFGGGASFATIGATYGAPAGIVYGNKYAVPLIGGSGGGGAGEGGGGGGGAILIAATGTISILGSIDVRGGFGCDGGCFVGNNGSAGGGSGGAIRFVATHVIGSGSLLAAGGSTIGGFNQGCWNNSGAGAGVIRIDSADDTFSGATSGSITRGYQPIIIPPANQAVSLAITSIAGNAVSSSPGGSTTNPDVTIPSALSNPVNVVVTCTNLPLNTEVILEAKPAQGPVVTVIGFNVGATPASSTATIPINLPRGVGTIQAKAVSGLVNLYSGALLIDADKGSYARTGLTADGERIANVEVCSVLGGGSETTFITESGKRHALPR